jgi:hypothetical protein
MSAGKLTWKQDGYLHFAHAEEGMWTIEQHRGRFLVTLDLKGTRGATQDMGSYKTMKVAKAIAQQAHRVIIRDFFAAPKRPRRYSARKRAYGAR